MRVRGDPITTDKLSNYRLMKSIIPAFFISASIILYTLTQIGPQAFIHAA